MMGRQLQRFVFCFFAVVSLGLAGCGSLLGGKSPPVRHYVLSTTPTEQANPSAAAPKRFSVAFVPVAMPEYLESRMIVTRTTENTVDLAEFDNWAAPLSEHVTSVMQDNLVRMIPTDKVVRTPLPRRMVIDYELRVGFDQFELDANGDVVLIGRWALFDEQARVMVKIKRYEYRIANVVIEETAEDTAEQQQKQADEERDLTPADYRVVVAAMSRALGDLCRDMADAIRTAARERS